MDLSELKPSERIIEITNPKTEEALGVKVTLLSINDVKLKKIKRKITDERLRLQSKGKAPRADDVENNWNKMIFEAMTGWQWGKDVTFKGEVPKFDQRSVFAVFDELPWFKEQIEEAISDEKAFFQT